jgi:CheY-like chemotaxis protein
MPKSTIIVCDDEQNIRAAIRLILERDYALRFAADGLEVVTQLDQQPANLVLLDIKLPGIDGLEVLNTIMARPHPPKVVMLTAYQSVELAQRAIHGGAVDYVTKPFERAALLSAVQRALGASVPRQPKGTDAS